MPTVTRYHSVKGRVRAEDSAAPGKEPSVDYVTDALGSVVGTASASSLVNRYRYKPYGDVRTATIPSEDPDFLWVGAWGYRSTGRANADAYVRARHYSSREGRWTSADPLWPVENVYGYVGGSPIQFFDWSGLSGVNATVTGANAVARGMERAAVSGGAEVVARGGERAVPLPPPVKIITEGVIATGELYNYVSSGGQQTGFYTGAGDWLGQRLGDLLYGDQQRSYAQAAPLTREQKKRAGQLRRGARLPAVDAEGTRVLKGRCKKGRPGSDCSEEEQAALQKSMKEICDIKACDYGMSCQEIYVTMLRFEACKVIRKLIMDKCFRGGNKGHREQYNNRIDAQNRCYIVGLGIAVKVFHMGETYEYYNNSCWD